MVEAKDLPDVQSVGTMDPYVRIKGGMKDFKTPVHENGVRNICLLLCLLHAPIHSNTPTSICEHSVLPLLLMCFRTHNI